MVCRPFEILHGYPPPPPRSYLSCDHRACPHPTSSRRGALEDRTEDRRIGLNMNYSIIFTEISFSPETSILLQIIQIIHITLWIMPEFDREGRAVCQFWLQGGKSQRDSHRQDLAWREPLGDLRTPSFLGERRGL